jgi:hypothetical protein
MSDPADRAAELRVTRPATRDQVRRVEPWTTLGEWLHVVDGDSGSAAAATRPAVTVEHELADLAPLVVVAAL